MNKMRWLSVSCLLFPCTLSLGQPRDSAGNGVPVHAIKVSPLHLLNFYPTIEVSYEKKIFRRFTLQAEGGYVLNYPDSADELYQDKRGVKLKLEGRYYLGALTEREKIYYVAIEPYANVIDFDRLGAVEECFDLECNHPYTRQISFKVKYREKGASLKAGMVWYVGSGFLLDVSAGFTLRDIIYEEPPLPDEVGYEREWALIRIPNEDDRVTAAPYLGFRFGYRLK